MIDRDTSYFLPASVETLRDFTGRLGKIISRAAPLDNSPTSLSISRSAILQDRSAITVKLGYCIDEDLDEEFLVSSGHAVQADRTWDKDVVYSLFNYSQDQTDEYEMAWGDVDNLLEDNPEDWVQGYLQLETRLEFLKYSTGGLSVAKTTFCNVLDEDGYDIDTYDISSQGFRGMDADCETADLSMLYKFGELMLDTRAAESSQSNITPSDLIVAMNRLQETGVADKRMRAFTNAPAVVPTVVIV